MNQEEADTPFAFNGSTSICDWEARDTCCFGLAGLLRQFAESLRKQLQLRVDVDPGLLLE